MSTLSRTCHVGGAATRASIGHRWLATLLPALLAPLAQAAELPPPLPAVAEVVDMGLVQQNKLVQCRDGTYSVQVGAKAYWGFNDTCLKKGGVLGDQFIDNTLSWSTHLDASAGIRLEKDKVDAQGVPVRFVPLTPNEVAFNAAHAPNEIAIWPGPMINDPARNRVLVSFGAVYRGADIGFNGIGAGFAVANPTFTKVTRPRQNPDPKASEPSYLWGQGELAYTGGAVVVGDMLYTYAGEGQFLSTLMHVARVPLAGVLDKSQWQYFDGSAWSSDAAATKAVYTGGAAGDNIWWNEALQMYVTVYQPFLDNTVYYRVARHPEGPWSAQAKLFTAQQGTDPSYAARVHTEYAEQGGLVQYVSYVKNTGFLQQQLPLVKVRFAAP